MWRAMANVAPLVKPGGRLFVAIYNDQGGVSRRWRAVKRLYNRAPRLVRPLILLPPLIYFEGREALKDLLRGRGPMGRWRRSQNPRGMHKWYDWLDWIGGYPFEVAKPEEVFEFYRARGFVLAKLVTQRGGPGCNEFVFVEKSRPSPGRAGTQERSTRTTALHDESVRA
jgi:2-polyprenyl-6-hydroxyphenyl methylase/3-demethylubiquinone-9 3-methyltransferase